MADHTMTDELMTIRDLLREGRVNEADRQLDEMQRKIREAEEQRKRDLPPPAKRTLAELQIDFADQVTDLLGNPPRLTNLIAEIKAEQSQPEPQ
jgi:hypothetical protein